MGCSSHCSCGSPNTSRWFALGASKCLPGRLNLDVRCTSILEVLGSMIIRPRPYMTVGIPPPDPGNRSNMQYHVLFVLSPSPTVTASAMITFTGRDASASYLAHNLQPFVTAILAQDSTADVHRLVPGEGGALAVLLAWLSSHAPGQATSHSSSGQIDVNPSGTALSPVVGTKHLELESNCMCNGMQYYIKRSPLKSCTSIIGGQISRVG